MINKYCFVSRINAPSIGQSNGGLVSQTANSDAYFLNTFAIGRRGQLEDSKEKIDYFNTLVYANQSFIHDQNQSGTEFEQFINYLGFYPSLSASPTPPAIAGIGPQNVASWGVDFDLLTLLCSKPFVLITGPSGTGKTRSIVKMATFLNYELLPEHEKSRAEPSNALALVPVGADWNDIRNMLGYRNPFGEERIRPDDSKTNLTYEVTPALKLLLRASHPAYRHEPHFLVLDEMNLSHVERYFSTFLSIIEADRSVNNNAKFELISKENLRLISEVLDTTSPLEAESATRILANGRGLSFPPNVFIVGTVNVDETTYMFSPKVLDRALVIEINPKTPKEYINGTSEFINKSIEPPKALELFRENIEARAKGEIDQLPAKEIFERVIHKYNIDAALSSEVMDAIMRVLEGTFALLKPVGFAFGARVTNEILIYMATWINSEVTSEGNNSSLVQGWKSALDNAVLIKILPKIHGNKRQLGDSLKALSAYLEGKDRKTGASYRIGGNEFYVEDSDVLPFPLDKSREKLERMKASLDSTLYTSFI